MEHFSRRGFSAQNKAKDEAGLSPGEDDNAVMHGKDRRKGVNSMEEQYETTIAKNTTVVMLTPSR
jgi:hypothetical protein